MQPSRMGHKMSFATDRSARDFGNLINAAKCHEPQSGGRQRDCTWANNGFAAKNKKGEFLRSDASRTPKTLHGPMKHYQSCLKHTFQRRPTTTDVQPISR